jgi:ELWxxDGT repeat protein
LTRAVSAVVEPVERRMMLSASLVLDGTWRRLAARKLAATSSSSTIASSSPARDTARILTSGVWSSDGTSAGTYEIHDSIDSGSTPVRIGDNVYFVSNGGLFRSDGTPAGTELITPNSLYVYGGWMAASNDTLYFAAQDDAHGVEIWKSNGTAGGTSLVKDITAGPASSGITWLVGSNGALFFKANGKLYYTDGTAAGTLQLRSIADITGEGYNAEVTADGTLYFTDFGPGEATLYKSDGTVAGTQAVKTDGSVRWPQWITPVGNTVYFTADGGPGIGRELFKSDGTPAGTQLVVDINASDSHVRNLTAANGRLYFTARAPGGGYGSDLWQTNGTTSSVVAADAFGDFNAFAPSPMKADHSALYFLNSEGISRTDGTAPPSVVYTGNNTLNPYRLTMAFAGDTMLYLADDHVHGMELWKTDGTVAGTQLAVDLTLRYFDYNQPDLFAYTGKGGIFVKENDIKGREPWFTDGTPGGTFRLKDLNTNSNSGGPDTLLTVNGVTYFGISTYDPATDTYAAELWRTDGTASGTSLVTSLPNGSLFDFTDLNGTLVFTNYDDAHGTELWKSDGTAAGTVMIKDILPGSESSYPSYLTVINGVLYFSADDGVGGRELYKSNGTSAGTVQVKDLVAGPENGNPLPLHTLGFAWNFRHDQRFRRRARASRAPTEPTAGTFYLADINANDGVGFAEAGGKLYFVAESAGHGYELWKTDGTNAGTQMVIELGAGTADADIGWVASLNNTVYFMRYDGTLYRSDGTAGGTTVVTALGAQTYGPVVFGNAIYFNASDPDHGGELWKTDGTAGGTASSRTSTPGPTGAARTACGWPAVSFISSPTTASTAKELWRTDGTEAGTVMVKDNSPGGFGGVFNTYGTRNNQVVFYGSDGASQGLFFSDGTAGGTHSIGPLNESSQDSNPYLFTQIAGQVYFFASDGIHDQLYRTDGTTAGTVQLTHFELYPDNGWGAITTYNGDILFLRRREDVEARLRRPHSARR